MMEDFNFNHISLTAEDDDQFPIGLKVLAIDTNIVCLQYLVQLLKKCQYKVTATTNATEAIKLLKDEKQTFDIVITNVVRHDDIDGFKILQIIGVGMDIPVIMVSANEEFETRKRVITEGAVDYLIKPLRLQEIKNIWQHVLRKRLNRKIIRPNPNYNYNLLQLEQEDHNNNIVTKRVEINQRDYDYNHSDDIIIDVANSKKKKRVRWTNELHQKFLQIYEQLGEKERVPNNIWKLMVMDDPSLTRENVASHLQKHRNTLKKKKTSGVGKNLYDINSTNKVSTIFYNSMNHIDKVSNFGPQFQSPNEQLQGNQSPRSTSSTTTVAGSYFPMPEFNWSNFSSNYYSSDHQNFGAISDFPNNTTPGQCSQKQLTAVNSYGSLLMDDDSC